MTDDGVWLDPAVTSAGATDLTGAGQDLIDILSTAGRDMAARTQALPWGADEFGTTFDRGYRPAEQQFLIALATVGSYLRLMGEQVTAVVEDSQHTDQTAWVRVKSAARKPK